MDRRYYFDKYALLTIRVIDKETKLFWHRLESDHRGGTYWSRSKKCPYEELVFDTFEEAKADFVRRLQARTEAAANMTGAGEYVWVDIHPKDTSHD